MGRWKSFTHLTAWQGSWAALQAAGCARIFQEKASGGRWDRPELQRMLDQLRPGDLVHVWKLDRLGRSQKDLLRILEKIEQAGAGFQSITEGPAGLAADPRDYDVDHYARVLRDTYAARLARALAPGDFAAVFADPDQFSLFAPSTASMRPVLVTRAVGL